MGQGKIKGGYTVFKVENPVSFSMDRPSDFLHIKAANLFDFSPFVFAGI